MDLARKQRENKAESEWWRGSQDFCVNAEWICVCRDAAENDKNLGWTFLKHASLMNGRNHFEPFGRFCVSALERIVQVAVCFRMWAEREGVVTVNLSS